MQMLAVGADAPALDSLSGLLHDGPVLLAFFKVSCPTCQLAFPFLDRISKGNLKVVGVSQDTADLTNAFKTRFGVTFEIILDAGSAGYPMSNAFGISHVPSLFVIEKDGRISHSGDGFDKAEFEKLGRIAGIDEVFRGEKVPAFKPG